MPGLCGEEVTSIIALALAAASANQSIHVSREGDDGLTVRFTDAYEHSIVNLTTAKPLKVTVEQITPINLSRSRVVVRFEPAGKRISKATCVFRHDTFANCVGLAARRTRDLARR